MRSWGLAVALELVGSPLCAQPALGPFGSVAGGEFTASLRPGVERVFVQVGPTPVACELAATRAEMTCDLPTTLGPGSWPVEIDVVLADGQRAIARAIVELRVPMIVAAEPQIARPGATIELELEAPIPTGEPVELLVLGDGVELVLEPQLVRAARLRARLPNTRLPAQPLLELRVRDLRSQPYVGLIVNHWLALAMSWVSHLVPGLIVGAAIALGVIVLGREPERKR